MQINWLQTGIYFCCMAEGKRGVPITSVVIIISGDFLPLGKKTISAFFLKTNVWRIFVVKRQHFEKESPTMGSRCGSTVKW
jgi:hypothetical protein